MSLLYRPFLLFQTLFVVILSLVVALSFPSNLIAKESPSFATPAGEARILTESDGYQAGGYLTLGLDLHLIDGWHTYWKNPGDAGDKARITVSVNEGQAQSAEINWPSPLRISENGAEVFGYKGKLLLPFKIKAPSTETGTFRISAEWLVCRDICIPIKHDFQIALSQGENHLGAHSLEFGAVQYPRLPQIQATLSTNGRLVIKNMFKEQMNNVNQIWFLPDEPGLIDNRDVPSFDWKDNHFEVQLKPADIIEPNKIVHGILQFVYADNNIDSQEIRATTKLENHFWQNEEQRKKHHGYLLVLILAFLGGVILNFMPCVFPVLALKVMSLITFSSQEKQCAMKMAWQYSLGIILTFMFFGGFVLIFREAGTQWGFQFQSPVFVAIVCWVLLFLAFTFLGIVEVGFSLTRIGGKNIPKLSMGMHNILLGVMAVVVATPCVAPFMGTAMIAAMTQPLISSMAIFFFLGLGLAAPIILLIALPSFATYLPKPGRWMVISRQLLAFPLLAGCVWLLWVVSIQIGAPGVLLVSIGSVIIGFMVWLYSLIQDLGMRSTARRVMLFCRGILIISAICLFSVGYSLQMTSTSLSESKKGVSEKENPFSTVRYEELAKKGHPVFVDISAAWCLTCLVNERVALKTKTILDFFKLHEITVLKGDWTNADPDISAFLQRYGRQGVPFYLFKANDKAPIVLPQLLTPKLVRSFILKELD